MTDGISEGAAAATSDVDRLIAGVRGQPDPAGPDLIAIPIWKPVTNITLHVTYEKPPVCVMLRIPARVRHVGLTE